MSVTVLMVDGVMMNMLDNEDDDVECVRRLSS